MIKHIVIWKLKNKTTPIKECEDALAIKGCLGKSGRQNSRTTESGDWF